MSAQMPSRSQLQDALSPHGLRLRGGWRPVDGDVLPALPDGRPPAVVWMVGGVGSELWPAFRASPFYADGLAHPLDRWSLAIGQTLAQRWGGLALFPFDGPPYYPFQQWAARAETLHSSPLMLRIHPEFGLWHAYRFALALPTLQPGDLPETASPPAGVSMDLCLQCDGQPCLQACPVQAFDGMGFQVEACSTHLRAAQGQACMQSGCLARRACPWGRDYLYTPAHAAFHMQAFVAPCSSTFIVK